MISRGRSVVHDRQRHPTSLALAGRITRYLHHSKNEQAIFIKSYGTAFPNNLEKSLDCMIMMGELSKSDRPLYQAILSPDLKVDKNLTDEEWERMRQIQAKHLNLDGQPYIEFEHVMKGRKHRHYFYQRYNPETGNMISDSFDYKAHAKAREEIELEFGHDRTFQPLPPEKLQKKKQVEKVSAFLENIPEIVVENEEDKKRREIKKRLEMFEKMREEYRNKSNEQNQGLTY